MYTPGSTSTRLPLRAADTAAWMFRKRQRRYSLRFRRSCRRVAPSRRARFNELRRQTTSLRPLRRYSGNGPARGRRHSGIRRRVREVPRALEVRGRGKRGEAPAR